MATWGEISSDFRLDAFKAGEADRLRTSLNRCYYAVFARLADRAAASGWTFPHGREGPTHQAVYGGSIAAAGLGGSLAPSEQGRLISICALLYRLRCMADYSPSVDVQHHDVRLALGRMVEALQILEGAA